MRLLYIRYPRHHFLSQPRSRVGAFFTGTLRRLYIPFTPYRALFRNRGCDVRAIWVLCQNPSIWYYSIPSILLPDSASRPSTNPNRAKRRPIRPAEMPSDRQKTMFDRPIIPFDARKLYFTDSKCRSSGNRFRPTAENGFRAPGDSFRLSKMPSEHRAMSSDARKRHPSDRICHPSAAKFHPRLEYDSLPLERDFCRSDTIVRPSNAIFAARMRFFAARIR